MLRPLFRRRPRALPLAAPLLLLVAALLAGCSDSSGSDDDGLPVISAVTPSTIPVGSPAVTITVEGRRFSATSVVAIDDFAVPTTFVSETRLTAVVNELVFEEPSVREVRVYTPGPGEGLLSAPRQLTVSHVAPTLAALSFDTASAGRSDVVVTATGTGFSRHTVARWNGAALSTSVRGATELSFVLGSEQLAAPGTFQVTLANPGAAASAARAFTVSRGAPVISLLPSAGATAGGPGFTLAIHGSGFVQGTTVEWNGVSRGATYVSASRLEVPVSALDVASPGTATLRVRNPDLATPSNAAAFTVRALPSTAVTSVQRVAIPGARDLAWDAATGRVYVSVRFDGGALAHRVAAIDPATGQVTGSVVVGNEPGAMARSADGQFLYVGIDGANAVRRVNLANFTTGPQFAVGAGHVAADLAVLPGQPGTVVVSTRKTGVSSPDFGVKVYDNGVARPNASASWAGDAQIEALESPSVVYGYQNTNTGFTFYAFGVSGSGVQLTAQASGLFSGFYQDIVGAAGRLYGTDGSVVDPERRVRLGSFGGGADLVAPDPATGRIFVIRNWELHIYDMNTLQPLGTVALPQGLTFDGFRRHRMVRVGTDGLAFLDTDELVVLRSPVFGS